MVEMNLDHIYKKYEGNDKYSVTDMNLDIKDGEFIFFIGPSGCGKSTTLRMIAGLEDITKGDFKMNGQVMNDVEPKNRDIAMVFQTYALYPNMSVFDNMAFGLKIRKTYSNTEIKKRVDNAAEQLGLTDYLQRKPANLSGGQRQRLAIARALVKQASAYVFDDSFSALDFKTDAQLRAELRQDKQIQQSVVVIVAQRIATVADADLILVLDNGKLVGKGTHAELKANNEVYQEIMKSQLREEDQL